jgi:hypothetical protein
VTPRPKARRVGGGRRATARLGLYVLHGREPIAAINSLAWAQWFETADRVVASTTIGAARVSTVFLGIDHRFGKGPPLLFETMVFGGAMDGEANRSSTWAEAEEHHAAMCARVRASP